MVRMMGRCAVFFAAALLLVCSPAASALAEGAPYTYTVRFYAGQQGTFADGREVIIYSNLSYGSVVSFNPGGVVLKDGSKYYVRGIRESGRDNNTVSASSFTVTGDRDYVVAYGLRGDMVAYVVNYVDEGGVPLAPSDIYYGNVGDKPVVAFLYIDGYQPQAYNLTRTLAADEAQNVFTFVYTALAGDAGDGTVVKTVTPGTDRSVVEVIPGDSSFLRNRRSGIPSMRASSLDAHARTDEDMDAGNDLASDADLSSLADPFQNLDLDGVDLTDPAVPLADMRFRIGPVEMDARMLLIMIVILAAVSAMLAASWWYWMPYRKRDEDEKNAVQPV